MRKVALALAIAISAAVTVVHPARAQQTETVTLATAGLSLFNYLPVTLAERIGAFKQQGLKVEISDFAGGQKSVEALVGGSIQMAVASFDNAIFLQTKGIKLVNVVLINQSIGGVIAIANKHAASIKSPKDIKGMMFGVSSPGSATHRMLNLYLSKDGLKSTDVSVRGLGGGASAIAAIQSGRLDGFVHAEPVVSQALKDGQHKILVDCRTEEGMKYLYGGYIAATAILTTPAFMASRPQAVQKMANAMAATLKWMHDTPVDEVMAKIPPEFFGPDKDAYRATYVMQLPIFSKDGQLTAGPIERTLQSMVDEGTLERDQKVVLADTFDNRFAAAASK